MAGAERLCEAEPGCLGHSQDGGPAGGVAFVHAGQVRQLNPETRILSACRSISSTSTTTWMHLIRRGKNFRGCLQHSNMG